MNFCVLARNTQTSHADIAANITSYSLPAFDPASTSERFGEFGASLLPLIDAEVNRQALMIAYIDNFHAMAIFILLIAPVALLMRPMPALPAHKPPLSE